MKLRGPRWRPICTLLALGFCALACSPTGDPLEEDAARAAMEAGVQGQDAAGGAATEAGSGDRTDAAAAAVDGAAAADGASLDASHPQDAGRDAQADANGADAANPPDAGGGPSRGCASKAYKLCEDFEAAKVGALPSNWVAVPGWGGSATAVVADDEHHGGTKSLKGALASSGQARAGTSLSALGATANKHWGRIFYKVKSPATLPPAVEPPNFSVIHNTLVGLKGATESRVVDTVVNTAGKHQFLYNLPDDSCCTGSEYLYSSYDGGWHCAEWYVDAATQQFRFFYDGSEVKIGFMYGAGNSKAKIGDYSQIIVGWINYQTPKLPYNQAWFDDLAIDDNRIGCE
ncbi:MAG TPA: hypothetical protein VFZ61_04950 [Polyangiales bacterium]